MKNEENLIDSLLKEHAKMKRDGKYDENFLEELEQRIDEVDNVVSMNDAVTGASVMWGVGRKLRALAACVAIGGIAVVSYQSMNPMKTEYIALNNDTVADQMNGLGDSFYREDKTEAVVVDRMNERGNLYKYKAADEGFISYSSGDCLSPLDGGLETDLKAGLGVKSQLLGDSVRTMRTVPAMDGHYHSAKKNLKSSSSFDLLLRPTEVEVFRGRSVELSRHGNMVGFKWSTCAHPCGEMLMDTLGSNPKCYEKLVENAFITPVDRDSKLSTFSVDVDTASYANLRNLIYSGHYISRDSVRIEELVNYFDYQYAPPKGKDLFAIHSDVAICPWNKEHKLVRIALKGKDILRDERPASNIVSLLDVSELMNNANKLPLLEENLQYPLEELNADDRLSAVASAGASGLVLPATAVTDEGFSVGVSDDVTLTKIVKKAAEDGVFLRALGFGRSNVNDEMLESITYNGNGNYSYIDSVEEGRKVLLEDMMAPMVTIAKDVKVQVEFNPEKVKEYRLIGYSNRGLDNSAFLDKKVNTGEIGAGHTVTAFYEIVPGEAADKVKFNQLRYKENTEEAKPEAAENENELLSVKLAYKRPDQKWSDESTYFSKAVSDVVIPWANVDKDFKFASSVALFGMVVRESDYRGEKNLDLVSELAEAGKGEDVKGYRGEFIKLVKKLKETE